MQPHNGLEVMRTLPLKSNNQGLERIETLQHMFHRFTLEQLEVIFSEAVEKYPEPEPPKQQAPREIHIAWKIANGKKVFNNSNYTNHETIKRQIRQKWYHL
ncbi:MAG: hypothetical protein AB2L24_11660 [Mangrovibacterium sp.]